MKKNTACTGLIIIILVSFFYTGYSKTDENNITWQIEPQYEDTGDFVEGLAPVKKDGKWGYINRDGKYIIELRTDWGTNDYSDNLSEGLIKIVKDNRYGYINTEGKIVIEPQFENALNFSEGLAAVKQYGIWGKWGYINKQGIFVIRPQFDRVESFSESLAKVTRNEKDIYINKEGKHVIELPSGQEGSSFSEGLAFVRVKDGWGGKYGYINKEGQIVIEPQFESGYAIPFSDGLARVKIDEKYGYINRDGKMVIEPQFDYADDFSENLARVKLNNKWGIIDKTGKYKSKLQSTKSGLMFEGLAWIKTDDKRGFIDRNGKTVIKPQFQRTSSFFEGLAAVKKDGKWGFIQNPLIASKQLGQFIGEIKSVNSNQILVGGKDIASLVYMGDKLACYSDNNIVILKATFPMQTLIKCDILAGNRQVLKSGMKVYKYKRKKEE